MKLIEKITKLGVHFELECEKVERATPKGAGLWFHWGAGRCRPGCQGCARGVPPFRWWTPREEDAARLAAFAVGPAADRFNLRADAVEASRATAPAAPLNVPAPPGLVYLPYQLVAIGIALSRPRTLLGDEMGLGKTVEALGVVNGDPSIERVLVVAKASLRGNWLREARRWMVRPFTFHVFKNGPLPPEASFVICSYERAVRAKKELMGVYWDLVVVDEAHFLKNNKAKRTQAVLGGGKRVGSDWVTEPGLIDCTRRFLPLTGTPMVNRPVELHPLLRALDPRTWGGWQRFVIRYCAGRRVSVNTPKGPKVVWDVSGASNLGELQERLSATVLVRRLKDEVLPDLPPKRRELVLLDPTGAASALAGERRAAARAFGVAGHEAAFRVATQWMSEGRQIPFEEMSAARRHLAEVKLPHVVAHVRGMLEEGVGKVIVWTHHREEMTLALQREFKDEAATVIGGMSDEVVQAEVDRFQTDPTCRVFVGSMGAAGVGLTLTAAHHEVFAELPWTPGEASQCEDRAHRIGQEAEYIHIQHLLFDGSLDAKLAQVILHKQEVLRAALDSPTLVVRPVELVEKPAPPDADQCVEFNPSDCPF